MFAQTRILARAVSRCSYAVRAPRRVRRAFFHEAKKRPNGIIAAAVAIAGASAEPDSYVPNLTAPNPALEVSVASEQVKASHSDKGASEKLWTLFSEVLWDDLWALVGAAVLAVLATALGVLAGSSLGRISDAVGRGADCTSEIGTLGLLHLGRFVLDYASSLLASWSTERASTRLRRRVFAHLLEQDIAYFDTHRTGELAVSLNADIRELRNALRSTVRGGLTAVTGAAGATGAMLYTSPLLSVGLATVLAPLVVAANTVGAQLRRLARRSSETQAAAVGGAAESLANVRTVRAFTAEQAEEERYGRLLDEASEEALRLGQWLGFFHAGVALGGQALGAAVLWAGGGLVSSGHLSAGGLAGFLMQTIQLQKSVESLSVLASQLHHASGTAERVLSVLQREPEANRRGGRRWNTVTGDVDFHNVHFAYPSRPDAKVLRGLSLSIPAGKTVALVGSSGAGKSTVSALLQRFYEPDKGQVLVDGHDIGSVDIRWLRNHMAIVPQQPTLFAASVEENIRYGRPDARRDEILHAARQAGCDFIDDPSLMPHGLDTRVGEGGASLSGGQRQRVAIARALLRNPAVLILDEATSALDAGAEAQVQEALQTAAKGRTTIVIAHRLSTIQNADEIVCLRHGTAVERGTHQQLLKENGIYAALVAHQSKKSTNA